MNLLRWIILLPASLIVGLAADYFVTIGQSITYRIGINGKTSLLIGIFFAGFVGGSAVFNTAALIAPAKRHLVVRALCILGGVFAATGIYAATSLHDNFQSARFTGYLLCSIGMGLYFPKDKIPADALK